MPVKLDIFQREALDKLNSGNALIGGTGSGKSLTSIVWWYEKCCGGDFNHVENILKNKINLYIITTAKKRDDGEWDAELIKSGLGYYSNILKVDSWNNIKKYIDVKDSVFIFDEQRIIGSGSWVKSFYKIAKKNKWILLTATPGDKWEDYVPLFIANGYLKNRTDFNTNYAVWDNYCNFPKIKGYMNTGYLIACKRKCLVFMHYDKPTEQNHTYCICNYDKDKYNYAVKNRWDIYKDQPIEQAGGLCYILRRIVNSDPDRIATVWQLYQKHPRVIIFYNYNYELELLRQMCDEFGYNYAEWNGQKHEPIPDTNSWLYLVQYTAGNEGWNCISCSTIIFYSENYSYKVMVQAAGRIDRRNTPYKTLYYYHLMSKSSIDSSIKQSLKEKKNFNEKIFERKL